MGRHWLKLIGSLTALHPLYRAGYPVRAPGNRPVAGSYLRACRNLAGLFRGRRPDDDGYALYEHRFRLRGPWPATMSPCPLPIAPPWIRQAPLSSPGSVVIRSAEDGEAKGAWRPDRLEYRFSASAPTSAARPSSSGGILPRPSRLVQFDIAPEAERLVRSASPGSNGRLVPMPISFPASGHPLVGLRGRAHESRQDRSLDSRTRPPALSSNSR